MARLGSPNYLLGRVDVSRAILARFVWRFTDRSGYSPADS